MADMKTRSSKISGIIIVSTTCLLVIYRLYNQHRLDLCSRYTVATGYRITGGYQNQYFLDCVFYVDGKRYTSLTRIDYAKSSMKYGKEAYRAEKHFVKYSCSNPNISELLMNRPVPGTILSVPKEGWERLPVD
jgi:hypothetical protein